MFELPECVTLACQLNESVTGKTVRSGSLGNSPHKFVWYNRTPDEFARLTEGKTAGEAHARGKWLFVPLEPGYVLVLGECGGRLLYHAPSSKLPDKYHLWLALADGSSLTLMTQMWGALELYEQGQERERQYLKDMRPTPVEPEFTFAYFSGLLDETARSGKRSAKALLTQEQLIPGLGNALAQDILFRARIHPRRWLHELSASERSALYEAILATVAEAIAQGGRCDELDLYGRPGRFARLMDSRAAGKPCPVCGTTVQKLQYLGGACYFCPCCQK